MGNVPKQVLDMEAEADELLEQQAAAEKAGAKFALDTDGNLPSVENAPLQKPKVEVAQPAPEKPVEQPPPAQGGAGVLSDVRDTFADEKAAQNQRLLYARLEQTSSENKELKKQNAQLVERITSLEDEMKTPKAAGGGKPAHASTVPQDRDSVRKFLREKMGENYTDNDLDAFTECVDALVQRRTDGISKRIDEDRVNAQKAKLESFMRHMAKTYPAFPEMDNKNDPRWVEFLNSQINPDVPGITYRQLVQNALQNQDYSEFERYVKVFGKAYGIDFSLNPRGKQEEIEGQQVPESLPARKPVAPKQQKPQIVSRSEIDQFRHSFIRKTAMRDYGMTADQVSACLQFYEDAEAEGRVDETR